MADLSGLVLEMFVGLALLPIGMPCIETCLFILHCKIALFCLCAGANRNRVCNFEQRNALDVQRCADILRNSLETLNTRYASDRIQAFLEMNNDCILKIIEEGEVTLLEMRRNSDEINETMAVMVNDERWFCGSTYLSPIDSYCFRHHPTLFDEYGKFLQSFANRPTRLEILGAMLEICDKRFLGITHAAILFDGSDTSSKHAARSYDSGYSVSSDWFELFVDTDDSDQFNLTEYTEHSGYSAISWQLDTVLSEHSECDVISHDDVSWDAVVSDVKTLYGNVDDDEESEQSSDVCQQPVNQTSDTASIQSDGESSVDLICSKSRLRNEDI